MRMNKTFVSLAAALLLLGASAVVVRADEDDAGKHEHHMSAAKLKDKLGLSDEQVSKLDAAWKEHKESVKPLRERLKKDMMTLKDQVTGKAKDDEIQKTLDSLAKTRDAMRDAMQKMASRMKEILSPTQRAKMELKMAKRRRHFWQRWSRHKDDDEGKADAKKG